MCVNVICVITLATFVHLSQITPALSCTFTERHYPKITGASKVYEENFNELQDCLQFCYENPLCNYLVYAKQTAQCVTYDNAIITNDTDWNLAKTTPMARFFVVDRNFSDRSCPTIEEWIKSDSHKQ